MKIRRVPFLALSLLALAAPATLPAQDLFYVVKGRGFNQISATSVFPTSPEAFGIESGIDGDSLGPAFPAPPNTLTPPGLSPVPLVFSPENEEWFFTTLFDSKSELDLAFPNGLYAVISAGGTASLNINGDLYPNAPQATLTGGFWDTPDTFTGGYAIAPGTPLKITTNAFNTNFQRSNGIIEISIDQTSGPGGFNDNIMVFNPASGAPISLNVPAGTLQANSSFRVELTFIRFATVTTFNNNPNYDAIGAYLSMTSFDVDVSGPGGVAPIVTSQTGDVGLMAPATATFKVTAVGTGPFTYQWQYSGDGVNFFDLAEGGHYSGTQTATLSVKNTNQFMTGLILQCVITGPGGDTTSHPVTLNVNAKPAITTQPLNQTVVEGGTATFTVVASGTGPLSYVWKKNGVPITGATDSTYSTDLVTPINAGTFTCTITNAFGTVTTAPAKLVIATRPVITTQPIIAILVGLLLPAVNIDVKASGTAPLSYQWQFSKDGVTFANLANGNGVTGATSASLKLAKAFFEKEGITQDVPCIFQCVVTNAVGSVTSNRSTVTPGAKPAIAMEPVNQTTVAGGTATFSIIASGSEALNYQWKKNGVNIPGQIDPTLTFGSVVAGDAASYTCVVTNAYGTATSKPAKLTVALPPSITQQPKSLSVVSPAVATFTVKAGGTAPFTYQWEISTDDGETFTALTNTGGFSGVTSATLKGSTVVIGILACKVRCVVNNGTGIPAVSEPATFSIGAKPVVVEQPLPATTVVGGSTAMVVGVDGSTPFTFQWKRNGVALPGQTGQMLFFASVVAGDEGTYTCTVTNAFGTVTSKPAKLTVALPPSITQQPANQAVIAPTAATFSVKATGTAPLTYQWQISVMGGNFTNLSNGGHFSGVTTATLKVSNTELPMSVLRFQCVVNNGTGIPATSEPASLSVGAKPVITTQPLGGSGVAGGNFTFTVVASGSGLSYQWKKNGVNISGQTNATLALGPLDVGSAGTFSCVVSNAFGSVTSTGVKLAIAEPPGGVYFGTYSGGGVSGDIALLVSGNNSLQVVAFSQSGRTASATTLGNVNVSNGTFSATLQPGNVQISGTCTGAGFSGTFTSASSSGTLTGTKKSSTGYLQSSAGFFGTLTSSTIGSFTVINPDGPSGPAVAIIAADGSVVFACIGSGPSAGTSFGGTGKVASNFVFTGTAYPPATANFSIVGGMGSGGAVGVTPFITGAFNQGLTKPRGAIGFTRTVPLIP